MTDASSNPFSTRFIRPGAIDYLFPAGVTAESLVDRLAEHKWQAAIVGPHGCGKSTLLVALASELVKRGRKVVAAVMHQGEHGLPRAFHDWRTWTSTTQVIVDGYEQLSWWSRSTLAWRIRDRGAGLLVTSHEPTSLPELIRVHPLIENARLVVRQLVADPQMISDDEIAQAFRSTEGDIREMLFKLYDLYEKRTATK